MSATGPNISELKRGMKATWMDGDFGQIAKFNEQRAGDFVSRLGLHPGTRVLDVACGTGNVTLPAARTGADVTGVDIATNLLEQGRQRAEKEGLKIRFLEGDAEQLPAEPAEYDVVCSMFGAMFAPRPDLVASELVRVCKPGGLIAMANWTPTGFIGQMFALGSKHVPPPPGLQPPVLWGDDSVVRQRFGPKVKVETSKQESVADFPWSPEDVVEHFRTYFGPTKRAFEQLNEAGQKALRDDLVQLWKKHNQGDDKHTIIRGEYLEVHARS